MNRELQPDRSQDPADGEARTRALLQLLGLVYEGTERPRALNEALALLAELTGAASILLLDTRTDRQLVAAAHAASAAAPQAVRLPLRSDRLRIVPIAGGFELVLDHARPSDGQLGLLTLLAPHLARALRLAEHRAAAQLATDANGLHALDRLPLAVMLLDRKGELALLNRAARSLLAGATALAIEERRLVPHPGVPRALFEGLVERATAPPDAERHFVGGRLELVDPNWGRIELFVARHDGCFGDQEVAVAVLLCAAGVFPGPEQRLRELHGLSADEARVAVDLIVGRPPAAPSDGDLPTLIRGLYGKLGSTRQADLLRLLLRPPGVVFERSPRTRAG
jgi:hypothetical protein